jgi:hypothetical protein
MPEFTSARKRTMLSSLVNGVGKGLRDYGRAPVGTLLPPRDKFRVGERLPKGI